MSDHGKFVWYELMTNDHDAAEAFYRTVAGWGAEDSGHPAMRYTMLTVGPRPVAGLMEIPAGAAAMGMTPAWIGYVGVEDVDAAAERLKAAGGTVHRPPDDIPGVGRFAMVADPQGGGFVLFSSSQEMGGEPLPPATPGLFSWHELRTSDPAAAFDFYAGQFGWTKGKDEDMGEAGPYRIFHIGGEMQGGMVGNKGGRPSWLFYVNVEDIDAAIAGIKANGGTVEYGPEPIPGGHWMAHATDPQGAAFAIAGPRR